MSVTTNNKEQPTFKFSKSLHDDMIHFHKLYNQPGVKGCDEILEILHDISTYERTEPDPNKRDVKYKRKELAEKHYNIKETLNAIENKYRSIFTCAQQEILQIKIENDKRIAILDKLYRQVLDKAEQICTIEEDLRGSTYNLGTTSLKIVDHKERAEFDIELNKCYSDYYRKVAANKEMSAEEIQKRIMLFVSPQCTLYDRLRILTTQCPGIKLSSSINQFLETLPYQLDNEAWFWKINETLRQQRVQQRAFRNQLIRERIQTEVKEKEIQTVVKEVEKEAEASYNQVKDYLFKEGGEEETEGEGRESIESEPEPVPTTQDVE